MKKKITLYVASWYVAGVDHGAMAFNTKAEADEWNRDCLAETLNIDTEFLDEDADENDESRELTDEEIWEAINDQEGEMINYNVETQVIEVEI